MKNFLKAILLAAGLFAFNACEQSTGGSTDPSPKTIPEDSVSGGSATLDKSKIAVYMTLEPILDNTTGANSYSAYCQISDYSGNKQVFNNAVVKINDVVIQRLSQVESYYKSSDIGTFSAGDTIIFTLEDTTLGNICLTETVPDSISDFTTTPTLPATGTANTLASYAVSWTAVPGVDEYQYWSMHYDSSSTANSFLTKKGYGGNTTKTSSTASTSYNNYNPDYTIKETIMYQWIGLSVNTRNNKAIPGFYGESGFRIEGTKRVFKHN